jgi:hypothetical protein
MSRKVSHRRRNLNDIPDEADISIEEIMDYEVAVEMMEQEELVRDITDALSTRLNHRLTRKYGMSKYRINE